MPGIKAKRKQLVRKTLMRAKAQSERPAEQRQESPEEYAQTEVQQGISDVAARTSNTTKSTARMSYRKFRAMQEKRKNLTLQGSAQSASKPTEKEKVTVPTQTERREMFKKQRFRQKAIAAKTPAPQAPVPSSATPAPPPYQAQMQQHLKRQHLTREAVRRYLQKQTTATAAGNTAPIVTHAPKLPTISNKQAAVEAISRGVHYIAAKIKALLSQTVRRAAQSLLGAVEVSDIPDKKGFLVRDRLIRRLDQQEAARYRLDVVLDDRIEGFGVRGDNTIIRERRTLRARYRLVELATDKVVPDTTASADAGIDVVSSEYAVVAAEETAMGRLADDIADQIVARLALLGRERQP